MCEWICITKAAIELIKLFFWWPWWKNDTISALLFGDNELELSKCQKDVSQSFVWKKYQNNRIEIICKKQYYIIRQDKIEEAKFLYE